MRKKNAFTLLELLVALSLSTFVIMGLLQSQRTLMTYIDRCRNLISTNRKVCLLFNQLERDFMTAFIPTLHEEIEPEEKTKQKGGGGGEKKAASEKNKEKDKSKEPLSETEQKKKEEKENEKIRGFFLGETVASADPIKIEGQKFIPFKSVTFINTNPLQIYGSKRVRFVRIKYELVKNKAMSKGEKTSYQLVRKETQEIENVKVDINEFDYEKQKTNPIRTHIIADNVKNLFIEYVSMKEQKKDNTSNKDNKKQELEEFRTFQWGDKDHTTGVVPRFVEVRIVFWNEILTAEHSFHAIFPILSYPSETKKKKKEKKDKKGGEEKTEKGKTSDQGKKSQSIKNPSFRGLKF
jgi:hypothetical protein